MRVIGISGKARSGKDTLGRVFQRYGYERVALADKLKEEAAHLFPWVFEGPVYLTDKSAKQRDILIYLGQTLGREYFQKMFPEDPTGSLWIRHLQETLKEKEALGITKVFIPDVRYSNEVAYLRSIGALVLRVNRPGRPLLTPEQEASASETELDGYDQFDHVLWNMGSLGHFELSANILVGKIMGSI